MIVLDASTIVGAALKRDSVPARALFKARHHNQIAVSPAIEAEILRVLRRPKLAGAIEPVQLAYVLDLIFGAAARFAPDVRVRDCRDPKDDKYLELALTADAALIVSSDNDLLTLSPWRGIPILRPADYLTSGRC